jgi:hypothetical protein
MLQEYNLSGLFFLRVGGDLLDFVEVELVWLGDRESSLFFPLPFLGGEGLSGFFRKFLNESECLGKWGEEGGGAFLWVA